MAVRAKFKCVAVDNVSTDGSATELKNIKLEAVAEGSDENKEFFKWTPSGTLSLGCVNPAVNQQFIVGQEYYLDFTPA